MLARPSLDDREEKIHSACEVLLHHRQNGKKPNVKQASRDYKIPYSTLHAHFTDIRQAEGVGFLVIQKNGHETQKDPGMACAVDMDAICSAINEKSKGLSRWRAEA